MQQHPLHILASTHIVMVPLQQCSSIHYTFWQAHTSLWCRCSNAVASITHLCKHTHRYGAVAAMRHHPIHILARTHIIMVPLQQCGSIHYTSLRAHTSLWCGATSRNCALVFVFRCCCRFYRWCRSFIAYQVSINF